MHKHLLILLLGTAFLLSACGVNTPSNNLNTDYTLSGKVIGYDGGDASVEALWKSDSYGTGNIKADGTFSITLESNLSNNRLTSLGAELSQDQTCSSLDLSSENKGTILPVLTITKNSVVLGHIGQVSSMTVMQALAQGNYDHPNAHAIGQVYANQDATLKGNCVEAQMNMNLQLKKGWNPVHIATDSNAHTTLGNNGTNLNWYYSAQK